MVLFTFYLPAEDLIFTGENADVMDDVTDNQSRKLFMVNENGGTEWEGGNG